jgi:ABC-type multidrug transport system ATPase subunit
VCDRVAILQRGRLAHLQDMRELRQAQRVRVRFAGLAPQPPADSGMLVRQRQGDLLTLEYRGALAPLLAWLAQHTILDLHVEPLGLSEIYHHYHGNGA